ncbi:hypothetical protein SC499_20190 [Peribacillus simplex]|uniref:hypothetical protein n=1 Tax=Peribacillus simplex TaxID=1478 RepID=UPI00298DCF57|nr:hypothetical protein [Peribacillus simplex]MDW7616970.1 hypothetical protein [Peribacillus simplex]
MRISEYFNLEVDQRSLEFVDVNTKKDVELYIDPSWIHIEEDEWCRAASNTITGFFEHILELYENGQIERARELFDYAHEPNEICFGMSANNPEGTGASAAMLSRVFDRIVSNEMIEHGFIRRLEDVNVFIEDFGQDRLSDLVANIIRKHLVDFTREQCLVNKIELGNERKLLGHFWDNNIKNWVECNERPLVVDGKDILLVPKKVVVKNYRYTASQYCTHHVLVRRAEQHQLNGTHLVHQETKRDGTVVSKVFKKEIREEEIKNSGLNEKQYVLQETLRHPELLEDFRASIEGRLRSPATTNRLSDEQFIIAINSL